MKIIVGLGNYGEKYENTYHNVGFMALNILSEKLGKKIKDKECLSLTALLSKNNEKVVLALPQTYMNLSGEAVKSLMKKYGANLSDLVVVYDDVDLPIGSVRLRKSGSSGTHNGMRNIVENLSSTEFKRIRVGIGAKPEFMDMATYVLSSPTGEKKTVLDEEITSVAECLEKYIQGETYDNLMQKYNVKK